MRNVFRYLFRSFHMSQSYATEEQLAVAAVRRACTLTSTVFDTLIKNETLTKGDKSPVTGMCDHSESWPDILTIRSWRLCCPGSNKHNA